MAILLEEMWIMARGGDVWKEKFKVTGQTEKFNEKFDEKFNVTGQTDRVYLRLTRFTTFPLILTLLVGGIQVLVAFKVVTNKYQAF